MLLLTVNTLAVGDGFEEHPELISVTYALLALDVAVMYARAALRRDDDGRLATDATQPVLRWPRCRSSSTRSCPTARRVVLWAVGTVLLAWPTLGFRFGRLGAARRSTSTTSSSGSVW